MTRGLMKSASIFALGMAVSASAFAADLGGNCCADLEERVAELEATTVRKGNRKVSLTLSGQVNRTLMHWDDGLRSNTYLGLDNTNSSTRFNMAGSAKISGEWSAGFNITIDVADNARTATVSQKSEDGSSARAGSSLTAANADHLLRLRDANWWIQRDSLGRLTVGRLTTAGGIGTPDLGGVGVVATAGEGCIGTSMAFRDSANALTANSIGGMSMGCAHTAFRGEGIKYTSPTWHGFVLNASTTEALKTEAPAENAAALAVAGLNANGNGPIGRNSGIDLKYAGEFNGVRLAAAIGYEQTKLNEDDGVSIESKYSNLGLGLALMHVPTGLFIQGEMQWTRGASAQFVDVAAVAPALLGTRTYTGAFDPENKAERWHLQGGLARNFFGIGNTVLYAEYGRHEGWRAIQGVTTGVKGSDRLSIWGLGVVQNIDAAAMELYLGYRNYSADGIAGVTLKDIDIISAGARIKF